MCWGGFNAYVRYRRLGAGALLDLPLSLALLIAAAIIALTHGA
jgi:hypothetical protein